ncbi:MAG: hypothetical protein NTV49_08040, partial [Kiritimatiellaeota bacterium]|nr:hypothetical protein [Kiritimatiellota bacterium]
AALRAQVEVLTREKAEAQRRADDLATQLAAARSATAPATEGAPGTEGKPATDLSPAQLAASDSRVTKLINENARLNEEVKRSTLELARLARQVRLAEEQRSAPAAGGASAAPADAGTAMGSRNSGPPRKSSRSRTGGWRRPVRRPVRRPANSKKPRSS